MFLSSGQSEARNLTPGQSRVVIESFFVSSCKQWRLMQISRRREEICVQCMSLTVQSKSLLHLHIRHAWYKFVHSRRNGENYNVKRVK